MSLRIAERVHIIPLGYEERRVYEPAKDLKADVVILLRHDDEKDEEKFERHLRAIETELEEAEIDYTIEPCDFFNLYRALGKIAKLITTYADDDVYVNIATGSKITAIAGVLACMATDEAIPYYVRANDYDGVPTDLAGNFELPIFPITAPKREQIAVLNFLDEGGAASKKDLIEFGEENQLPFVSEHDVVEDKAKYGLLDKHIINELQSKGYVDIRPRGREKIVSISDIGADILQAFRYLLDDS